MNPHRSIHFRQLLIAICLFFLGYPILVDSGLVGKTIEALFGLTILRAGLQATPGFKTTPRIVWVLLGFLAASWIAEVLSTDSDLFSVTRRSLLMFFFIRFIYLVGRDVFVTQKVDSTDRLYGAICIYLLTAMFFADLYSIVETLNPKSFQCGTALCPNPENVFHDGTHIYFSLITLTTVGYGDITATQPVAGLLCALEALMGQMYLGIVVARLVGLHLLEVGPHKDQ